MGEMMPPPNTNWRIDAQQPQPTESPHGPVWLFFGLVLLLSIPFWAIGGFPDVEILPGLPLSALKVAAPVTAAVILVRWERGPAGVATLLRRAFDYRRITARRWYVPTIVLLPLAMLAMYGVMRLLDRLLPDPTIQWVAAPVLLLVFFISALAEELGWSGYALEPLQQRWGALRASVLLGGAWATGPTSTPDRRPRRHRDSAPRHHHVGTPHADTTRDRTARMNTRDGGTRHT
jgi:membrane protease YdiL (CAAX protease family)